MGRTKTNKQHIKVQRNDNGELQVVQRFKQGESAPEAAEEKGNIRALLQGLSITVREPKQVTAQNIFDWEMDYLRYIYDSEIYLIPDYLGWCSFIGMTRNQMDYIQNTKVRKEAIVDGNGDEIYVSPSEMVQKAKNDFMAIKSQLGLSGKMPPLLYVGMMNNGGGWSTKQEIAISANPNPVATASNAELDKMLEDYKSQKTIEGSAKEVK